MKDLSVLRKNIATPHVKMEKSILKDLSVLRKNIATPHVKMKKSILTNEG